MQEAPQRWSLATRAPPPAVRAESPEPKALRRRARPAATPAPGARKAAPRGCRRRPAVRTPAARALARTARTRGPTARASRVCSHFAQQPGARDSPVPLDRSRRDVEGCCCFFDFEASEDAALDDVHLTLAEVPQALQRVVELDDLSERIVDTDLLVVEQREDGAAAVLLT